MNELGMEHYMEFSPQKMAEGSNEADGESKKQGFTFSATPTLEDIRESMCRFRDERNWGQYHTPRNVLLALVGEVGELAELFQWRGEVKEGLVDFSARDKERVGEEMSDILIYLVMLADRCRIDLPKAITEKMNLNALKYPRDKVKGDSRKYNEYPS
ncbi:unnamed protein product [Darwinula stevensoni]|uniref:dCTP pyrophosphatase 1 n=1 Tax=Darwinula stevensoni TaxID=69355 RepID=A0A7R8XGZ9_9CRUS|nr:unnamed protein product [Darwinula stevensoni]CAG0892249.1 unnamed protein product [Darwinula stevensoni]